MAQQPTYPQQPVHPQQQPMHPQAPAPMQPMPTGALPPPPPPKFPDDGPDWVMLVRLFPDVLAKSGADALKAAALKQGEETAAAGAKLVAAQQVPASEQAGEAPTAQVYGGVQPTHAAPAHGTPQQPYPPPGVPLTPAQQHPAR